MVEIMLGIFSIEGNPFLYDGILYCSCALHCIVCIRERVWESKEEVIAAVL